RELVERGAAALRPKSLKVETVSLDHVVEVIAANQLPVPKGGVADGQRRRPAGYVDAVQEQIGSGAKASHGKAANKRRCRPGQPDMVREVIRDLRARRIGRRRVANVRQVAKFPDSHTGPPVGNDVRDTALVDVQIKSAHEVPAE